MSLSEGKIQVHCPDDLKSTIASAYERLNPNELKLFLRLRHLPDTGSLESLVSRLVDHDLGLYGNRDVRHKPCNDDNPMLDEEVRSTQRLKVEPLPRPHMSIRSISSASLSSRTHNHKSQPRNGLCSGPYSSLPLELWALILEYLDESVGGGWEVSMALGFPTYMKRPTDWEKDATPIDYAILTGSVAEVNRVIKENSTDAKLMHNLTSGMIGMGTAVKRTVAHALRFSDVGANVMCRFGYTNLLTYFWQQDPNHFISVLGRCTIPTKASFYNRTSVLKWWFENSVSPSRGVNINRVDSILDAPLTLYRSYNKEAMDSASRNGHVDVLKWWKASGLPLAYSEASLEGASGRGHISVLDWWKHSELQLKIGKVMDLASLAGHIKVLDWWAKSGLSLVYDKALLNASSAAGGVAVLEWWKHSGLRLIYDGQALTTATLHDRPEILQWWKDSELLIRYRLCDIEEALEDAAGGGTGARRWWLKQGVNFNASNREWGETKTL